MSSKRRKVTFQQPDTKDLYDESLEEDVKMDAELEKELDVLDHLYRMADPAQRVKKYMYFQQSKYREPDEESVPRTKTQKIDKFFPTKRQKAVYAEIPNIRDMDLIEWLKNESIEKLKSDTQFKEGTSHAKLVLDTLLNFPITVSELDIEMKKIALSKGDEIRRNEFVFLLYNTQIVTIAIMIEDIVLNYWIKPKE